MIGLVLGALKARSCRELLSTGLGGRDILGSIFAFPFFLLSVFLAIWFTTRSGRSLLLWGVDSDINARKRGSSSSRARPPTRWAALARAVEPAPRLCAGVCT